MAIADDFALDYINKIVYHDSGTTVYTVNAFYSWLMDDFDELGQMDDDVPMSAQTPTSYTMTNGWYLQETATQFLEGGAIQTNGYTDEVRTLICGSPSWVNFASTDVGETLTGGTTGDTGTILDYDNTNYKIWIRMVDSGDTFDDAAETYTCGGTGSALSTAVSTTGETIFANPYTLGTLNGTPDLYIFQDGEKITSWWSSGHFDILIKVRETGADIDSKIIWVADHTWQSLYDSFQITLTTAGQNAVPLSTAVDLNNTSTVGDIEDYTDGTTATVAINFGFTTPFSYDIGDGNGVQDYEVEIDCDGQRLSVVYEVMKWWTRDGSTTQLETGADAAYVDGEEYRYAVNTYAESKASPLGTFAGGKMFGARSVYFTDLHADDVQAFQLIDKAGTVRYPPNYQSFQVTGLVAGDRVAIFLDTSQDAGIVNKSQYTLDGANAENTITVNEAIPNDTPSTGTIIVVDDDLSETAYAYSAWSGYDFTVTISASTYSGTETAYVPYIYETATGTSASESVVYVSNRYVICRVRKTGILPFETTGIFTSTGYSAAAIRNTDNIYT